MGNILVVAEIQGGQIREASYELASFAAKLASSSGRGVKSLVAGSGVASAAEEFSKKGGGEVFVADAEVLGNYNIDGFKAAIRAAVDAADAELILISSGYDAHRDDPLAALELVEADYHWITEKLVRIAAEQCAGRLVSTLEGGYDLAALAASVSAHVKALMAAG